ncbi:MAG: hypothetical protein JWN69_306 [Alphaproteobacteria bacterium]|nr:hypothetical protein [Alphaproteobacteria bacterium]
MAADREAGSRPPDPRPPDWEPFEITDTAERGGTDGLGALSGEGKRSRRDILPARAPEDPEREVRGEPLYGRDPDRPAGETRAPSPDHVRHEPGIGGPTIDDGSDPDQPPRDGTPMADNDPPQRPAFGWGGPGENYPPTRGPLDKLR